MTIIGLALDQLGIDPFFAIFAGWTLVYPFITVQRRLEGISDNHSMLPRRYLNARHAFKIIFKEEGLRKGFFRGY